MPNIFQRLYAEKDKQAFLHAQFDRKKWQVKMWIENLSSRDARFSKSIVRNRLGLRLLLDPTSLVDSFVIGSGTWEPKQVELMGRAYRWANTQQKPMFLDVGSYWGLYSLLAAKANMKTIHAFEADPKNHSQLRSQLFLNDLVHQINVHHIAVSDHTGTLTFMPSEFVSGGNRGSTGVSPEHNDAITVNCSSLDDVFDTVGATIIGKLDVEGHEPDVLRGMARLVSQNNVFLQVEEFEWNRIATSTAAKALGLRCVHIIDVDRYYTNIPDEQLGWLK